jgi:hypothetical protein
MNETIDAINEERLKKAKEEIQRLERVRSNNNWLDVRNVENYELQNNNYPWEGADSLKIPEDKYHLYVDLQASRGLNTEILSDDSMKVFLEKYVSDIKEEFTKDVNNPDFERAIELYKVCDYNRLENFVELGFRIPKLLEYYTNTHKLNCIGYDVVDLNVMLGSYFGYDTRKYDLNKCENMKLDIPPNSLVVSYHNLEHLTDPLKAIQTVYNSLEFGGLFHVEVPIEADNEIPALKFGHLYSFKNYELLNMLKTVGFRVMNITIRSNPQEMFERYLVYR